MPFAPLKSGDPVRLGRFELLARLGEGGQGVVYLGRGTGPGEDRVAVKVLRSSVDPVTLERLARELDAVHQVQPFVTAGIIEVGAEGDRRFVVSEFVDGPSLQDRVDARGPLLAGELLRLAAGTATALTAIHGAGVVHRDFKPANVLLGPDGPRVVDFGIARLTDAVTITSGVIGTPAYMAPEQLSGERPGSAVDIFAWAVTMVFAATGRPAFDAGTIPAVMHRILFEDADLSALPPALRPVVSDCLSKDPARRPTARDLLLRLVDPSGSRTGAAAARTSPYPPTLTVTSEDGSRGPARPARRGPALARRRRKAVVLITAATAVAALAAGGALVAIHESPGSHAKAIGASADSSYTYVRRYASGQVARYTYTETGVASPGRLTAVTQLTSEDQKGQGADRVRWLSLRDGPGHNLTAQALAFPAYELSLDPALARSLKPPPQAAPQELQEPVDDLLLVFVSLSARTGIARLHHAGQSTTVQQNTNFASAAVPVGRDLFALTTTLVALNAHQATFRSSYQPPPGGGLAAQRPWMRSPVCPGEPSNYEIVEPQGTRYLTLWGCESLVITTVVNRDSGQIVSATIVNPSHLLGRLCRTRTLTGCSRAPGLRQERRVTLARSG